MTIERETLLEIKTIEVNILRTKVDLLTDENFLLRKRLEEYTNRRSLKEVARLLLPKKLWK